MSVRKSVPMGPEDITTLKRMHASESPERQALAQLTGHELNDSASDAEILSALIRAGREAVTERMAATGYAAWAAEMDDEDRAYRRARRGWDRGDEAGRTGE
ncbi:molecular chaperone GrpE [Actinomadura sp. GC306]|uniref:molecular chaperone GrpE n=1 Tax=Actinomadura sp. GC306 TaxID=2530367 RepID=UPI00104D7201|nr:molecular chaperone GrpE [Actinomadura sp. GC306]TDC60325.1 molecular chaperone GrpE [Actinomadura sp. GC306]